MALVAAFVFGVLDDLVVSTKLLLTGKLPAAGNLMRQVVEGIAMPLLCPTDDLLIIQTKANQPPVMAHYWEKVWHDDERTQGHRAVGQAGLNAGKLAVTAGGVEQLHRAQKYYNRLRHCGTTTVTNRVPLEEVGVFHLGGLFDVAKLNVHDAELNSRLNLCRMLREFMEQMTASMTPPIASVVPEKRADRA
ncbi:hypothetical protein PQQ84_00205 [Paraburkholderia strydomiana]|uniref:hypothetical protein n=1 Tax=Paraburkholderia strydomiana TaxID=1245417 RepID=UPI0038B7D4A9